MEGEVRTAEEREQARDTHILQSAERDGSGQGAQASEQGSLTSWRAQRGTGQDSERKGASEDHSPTGEHRGMDKSGQRKEASKRGHSRTGERRRGNKSRQ